MPRATDGDAPGIVAHSPSCHSQELSGQCIEDERESTGKPVVKIIQSVICARQRFFDGRIACSYTIRRVYIIYTIVVLGCWWARRFFVLGFLYIYVRVLKRRQAI